MHGLQTIKRLNTEVVADTRPSTGTGALPVGERVADDATAHGLRQHSIGSTYPAVVVGYGNGSFGVQFGTTVVPCKDVHKAYDVAERIANGYRSGGWSQGQRVAADIITSQAAAEQAA